MGSRSREEALFGAAVLKHRLEQSGLSAAGTEVYEGVLADLGVTDDEVVRFIDEHGERVQRALREGRSP